jgi:hypothetical protein
MPGRPVTDRRLVNFRSFAIFFEKQETTDISHDYLSLRDHGGILKNMRIHAGIATVNIAGTGLFFQRFRDDAVDN